MISLEKKVGFVFFTGLVLLGIFTIILGRGQLFQGQTYDVTVHFDSIGSLKPGSIVCIAGVEVGSVKQIGLDQKKGVVLVTLEIQEDCKIPKNPDIRIANTSLMGGSYIDIALGDGSGFTELDQPLYGTNSSDISRLIAKVSHASDELSKLITSLNKNQDQTFKRLNELAPALTKTIDSLGVISEKIREGKGTLGKLLVDDELYKEMQRALKQAGTTQKEIVKVAQSLDKAIGENRENARTSLKQLADLLTRINKGEGTLGKLVSDDAMHTELTTTMGSVREAADNVEKFTGKLSKIRTYIGGGHFLNPVEERSLSRLYVRVEPADNKFYIIGADIMSSRDIKNYHDAEGDSEEDYDAELNLQLGHRFFNNHLALRGGLIEGRGGGALELGSPRSPLTLTVEGRDAWKREKIERYMLRSYLSMRLWKGLTIHAGGDNLVEDKNFFGGLSYEYSDEDIKYLIGMLGAR